MARFPAPDLLEPATYRVIANYDPAARGYRIVILSPFGDELYDSGEYEVCSDPINALAIGRGLVGEFVSRLAGYTDYRPAA
jgi:hypothetical protein